ncbi:MAG: hypothetical protein WKF84_30340 [Pyrinomonadaceae bacterium]
MRIKRHTEREREVAEMLRRARLCAEARRDGRGLHAAQQSSSF